MTKKFATVAFIVLSTLFAAEVSAQTSSSNMSKNNSPMTKAEFHQLCLRSWAVEHMNDQAGKRRDKDIITSPQCPGDSLIEKATDKDGFEWRVAGLYQGGNGLNGFGFQAGAGYTTRGESGLGFMGQVMLGASRTKFNENSVYAGESFLAMTVTTGAGFSFLKLDQHDVNRIWLEGGVEWNWAPSESQPVMTEDGGKMRLHTKTFTAHPYLALTYQHRLYNTGNSFSVSVGWKQDRSIDQNDGQFVKGLVFAKAAFNFGAWRHKTRNSGSQLW